MPRHVGDIAASWALHRHCYVARSLVWVRKKTVPHVNDPPVHLVACVRVHGRVLDMLFIQSLMPHTVPGVLVLIALILHLHVVGFDDGRGKVNQGVQFVFVAAPDLVVVLDVDKIRAFKSETLSAFRSLVVSTIVKL